MKSIVIFILIATSAPELAHSQTFDEWFKQNKTQKKYLIQQIAALKVYTGYLAKGYSIAQKGLAAIGNIKKGDIDLHRDFFGSLERVNPSIKNFFKVTAIITYQYKIMQTYKSAWKQLRSCNLLGKAEMEYIYTVFNTLISNSICDMNELKAVCSQNTYEMKDDERLKRIDQLYLGMQDKYSFARSFAEDAKLVMAERANENRNIETSRKLYGLNN